MAKKTKGHRPETPTEKQIEKLEDLEKQTDDLIKEVGQIEDLSGLPNRDLLRVHEVADYLSKAESTIRLWIDHGYFITEKFRGSLWVTKQSVIDFRLKNRVNNDDN